MSVMVYFNVFLCIFRVCNNLFFWCVLSLEEIITGKVLFFFKNEYLRLNGNGFNSGFGGWIFEGMGSIDRGGNFLICGF